ncbi:MAG TPA: hypothetical protein G4O16_09130 [Dehalococcoidia bacterium]|nr:hypothetical protein [Dehalococcoidia bacterium]
MSTVKLEAFYSTSSNSNDICLSRLIEDVMREFGDKVEIVTYQGQNELFNEYCLTVTPALVIEEMIKIMGFCPSKETIVTALRESGLE